MPPTAAWESLIDEWPTDQYVHRAVHLILLYHEAGGASEIERWKVFVFGNSEGPRHARVTVCHWVDLLNISDPNEVQTMTHDRADIFCSGHCHLADGNILIAGGNFFHYNQHYTPTLEACILDLSGVDMEWLYIRPMNHGRWYPTCTILMEGQVLVTSGLREEIGTLLSENVKIPD